MLHAVPLTLAHRAWVRSQSLTLVLGLSRPGQVLDLDELPGVVAVRDGRPVGYCLYCIERQGWEFTRKGQLESRLRPPSHPTWSASPGATRYQTECRLLTMWPEPHPSLLQGLRTGARQRGAYRIYTLVAKTDKSKFSELGFQRVAVYPDESVEWEIAVG